MMTFTCRPKLSSSRKSTVPRAWQQLTTLSELKEAKFSRVVVPIEGAGKILVQELDGTPLHPMPPDRDSHARTACLRSGVQRFTRARACLDITRIPAQ